MLDPEFDASPLLPHTAVPFALLAILIFAIWGFSTSGILLRTPSTAAS